MRQHLQNRTAAALRAMPALLVVMASAAWMIAGASDVRARPDDSEPAARNFTSVGSGIRRKGVPRDAAGAAVHAAVRGRFQEAFARVRASGDPVAAKVVEWIYLRRKPEEAGAERIIRFIDSDPKWPYAGSLRTKAEELLMKSRDLARLKRYFSNHSPHSLNGRVALAWLRMKEGRKKEALRHLRMAWHSPDLGPAAERFVLSEMRGMLSARDHETRLWRLITDQKTRAAVRTAGLLSRSHVAAAHAARALIRFRRNGPALYSRLPASLRRAPAMRYAMIRYWRKRGPLTKALAALEHPPSRKAQLDPVRWWTEKRLVARYLLANAYRKYWPRAYRLAASHGFSAGKPAFRGEFLAGFIALEKLGRKKQALAHFMRMTRHAKTRTQKAKAWYWVGRARETLGDLAGARRAYAESARTPTVYYGLLSREKIGLGRKPIPIRKGVPTAAARRDVAAHRFGRAVRLLGRAGGEWHVSAFIWPMAHAWNDRAHLAAAAALLWDAGGPAMAVKLAKAAGAKGIDIDNYGYPVKALPRFKHLGPPLEEPVLLGLIRQESEFNARAGSHAGAKGLMQLMPGTARREARILKVPYRRAWLISRPSYNLMLGRHHLSQLIRKFSGSYVLGFAAYNAGGGNVRKWLKAYGDFRTGRPDPIEWVELIPITETRKYVQKVLRGVHVYRTRLGRPMLPMSRDLWRGVPGWREQVLHGVGKTAAPRPRVRPAGDGRPSGGGCGKGSRSIDDLISRC